MTLVHPGHHSHRAYHVELGSHKVQNVEAVASLAHDGAYHVVTLAVVCKGTVNRQHNTLKLRHQRVMVVVLPPRWVKHVAALGSRALLVQGGKVTGAHGLSDALQVVLVVALGAECLTYLFAPVGDDLAVLREQGAVVLVLVDGRQVHNGPVLATFLGNVLLVLQQLADHVVLRPPSLNDHNSAHLGLKTGIQGRSVPVVELVHHARALSVLTVLHRVINNKEVTRATRNSTAHTGSPQATTAFSAPGVHCLTARIEEPSGFSVIITGFSGESFRELCGVRTDPHVTIGMSE